MSLLSWMGKIIGLRDGRFWSTYYGGETWAGRPVNEENSLQLSAWWRSVKLYADVVGALPLKFYERLNDGDRRQISASDHPVANLIAIDPNIDQTAQEFWGGIAAALAMLGNAYAEKRYVGKSLAALDPLPYDVVPDRTHSKDGELEYRYSDRGKIEYLPRDKVFHVRGFTIGKGDAGLSPLGAARQGLSISLATEEATGKTFSQGLRMSGFFTGPRLQPEQREDFKKAFIDPITGNDAKAHYGILENGFDFKPINIPPKDAEMLLSRRFNVEEICRFMGVPPVMVGHAAEGQTMWGSGVEAIINQWFTSGLNSFLTSIEKAINKRLLESKDRARFFAEFERNALLRVDSAARGELYWKLAQLAAMTPNQICDKENFPRFDGGDVRLVNSTLAPLSMLGQKPAARIQPAPGDPIPEPNDPQGPSQ